MYITGGLSDNILYIGVPVAGVALLILLLVCVLCVRRRKNKHKVNLQITAIEKGVDVCVDLKNKTQYMPVLLSRNQHLKINKRPTFSQTRSDTTNYDT